MKKSSFYFALCFLFALPAFAQNLIYTDPAFPVVDDDVTVYWNAALGDGGLADYSGDIWAHTGVITNTSDSATDWQHVPFDWTENNDTAKMTFVGNNIYSLSFNIRDFYQIQDGEIVEQMAFVFRNADGTQTGRSADGSDIYHAVYQEDQTVAVQILSPGATTYLAEAGETIAFSGTASQDAQLRLFDNGVEIAETFGTMLDFDITAVAGDSHLIEFCAEDDAMELICQQFTYIVPGTPLSEDPPANLQLGINYIDDQTVSLKLHAPEKQFVYVIGNFNDWTLDQNFLMKRSVDNNDYWLTIEGLTPGEDYTFQYYVDGEIKIADPYSEVVLDPSNDGWIPEATYPDLPAYPNGKTTGHVTLLQTGQTPYPWEVTDFQSPPKEALVIYELLLRDFLEAHDYKTLKDTLGYLEKLGINAIELLPVNEFEGNISWGYNPSFHMALDKYYGDKNAFKAFIDEAHKRGIAVIIDVVYNHAFSQSPLCKLYWDAANFRPAANNPWANPVAKHPFNVGYDLNHESQATKDFVDRNVTYWLEEFKIDGFRFDLSKGFTQVDYGDNVGAWSAYDASRITLLKRIADVVWDVAPEAYVILEHLSENTEEKELADYGMMLWGNMNYSYNEATMGYSNNDLSGTSHHSRNWNDPNLVAYMESHDEERLVYKNITYGNKTADYNITVTDTALQRVELATAFYYAIPGPKMLWQFGELGYDYSINYCADGTIQEQCRVDPKPIRWDYLEDENRQKLLCMTSSMIHLKTTHPVFNDFDASLDGVRSGSLKSLQLQHPDMDVNLIGNFGVSKAAIETSFPSTGTWYEYFTGRVREVTEEVQEIVLHPGEFRLFTSVQLDPPYCGYETFLTEAATLDPEPEPEPVEDFLFSPNPNTGQFSIKYVLDKSTETELRIFDATGRLVYEKVALVDAAGVYEWDVLLDLPYGVYVAYFIRGEETVSRKFIVGR